MSPETDVYEFLASIDKCCRPHLVTSSPGSIKRSSLITGCGKETPVASNAPFGTFELTNGAEGTRPSLTYLFLLGNLVVF